MTDVIPCAGCGQPRRWQGYECLDACACTGNAERMRTADEDMAEVCEERDALKEAVLAAKVVLQQADCECGGEASDSDHSYDSPICYRCHALEILENGKR